MKDLEEQVCSTFCISAEVLKYFSLSQRTAFWHMLHALK